jgi:hypothetical protein
MSVNVGLDEVYISRAYMVSTIYFLFIFHVIRM